jgi:hypothetical protein
MAGNSNDITMEQLGVLYSKVINCQTIDNAVKGYNKLQHDNLNSEQKNILKAFYGLDENKSLKEF